ncbi:hypothetical protein [Nocardia macrotermitis]|uniref:hypothetical protein n=1 Tax=Nocardia macrotermitis TaxID=2585198 RepID=UPI001885D38B|nr:hypothetical protein [Nocardia macrotermitis]
MGSSWEADRQVNSIGWDSTSYVDRLAYFSYLAVIAVAIVASPIFLVRRRLPRWTRTVTAALLVICLPVITFIGARFSIEAARLLSIGYVIILACCYLLVEVAVILLIRINHEKLREHNSVV